MTAQERPLPLLADCTPDCVGLTECHACDRPLCGDHSIDYVGCDASGEWHDPCHHEDCGPCQDEAARYWRAYVNSDRTEYAS